MSARIRVNADAQLAAVIHYAAEERVSLTLGPVAGAWVRVDWNPCDVREVGRSL